MELIIHCGLDKAGSTAIQAHVALFRPWLLRQGIYLPTTGLSGFGHVALFTDLGNENWQPLLEELSQLDQQAFSRCFLSYEGICFFEEDKLAKIKSYLTDYQVKVLFYLREQAEIIQSGYLQGLKSGRNPITIAHINAGLALPGSPNRDYCRMLDKFQSVFGSEAIALRLYQPDNWRNGSIVWDLLEFLQCAPDPQFTPASHRQNISLDAQSGAMLNVFDSYVEDSSGREALVEDLLWLVQKYPGGDKYFLKETAVRKIREHYRASNAELAKRHGLEFNYSDCAERPATAGSDHGVSYLEELAKLAHFPRWRGEQLGGRALATLLQHRAGWAQFESWGVWSVGDISRLDFRLPLARFSGFEEAFILNFRGRYFGDNAATQIWINGLFLEEADLRKAAVRIPLQLLDEHRIARLELRHGAADSAAARGTGNDQRRLAYGLQSLDYRLCS